MYSYESAVKRRKTENNGAVFLKINYLPDRENMTYSNNEQMIKSHHLPNFHHKRYEPVIQSTLEKYTSQSDGGRYHRRQHFQYGKAAGGSANNHLIYGDSDSKSLNSTRSKENIPKFYETPNDSFLYGKNVHGTSHSGSVKLSNAFSLEERTSAEIRKKQKELAETEKAYTEYLQEKEAMKRKRDEEKRKDLDELKRYKAPWGRPGGGAPKENHNRTRELNKLEHDNEQLFPFGNPGGGAPLKAADGAVKAGLPANPDIRFQKRAREQIHGIIHPLNTSPSKDPFVTDLDVLAQKTREKRHVLKREPDMSTSVYDPFGRPGAGAPLRDQQGRTKVGRTTNLSKLGQDSDVPNGHVQVLPFGTTPPRGGNGAPIRDSQGNIITSVKQSMSSRHSDNYSTSQISDSSEPWGRSGAGAPIRDENGTIITQVNGRLDYDSSSRREEDYDSKRTYLQLLRNQVEEHEKMLRHQRDIMANDLGEDTYSWMKRGVVGQPHYDPTTNEIIGIPRNTSDIVKHRLEYAPTDKQRSREYHKQLDEHFRNMKRREEEERRMQREKSAEHARTMENMWDNNDHKSDPRRRKVHFDDASTDNHYVSNRTSYDKVFDTTAHADYLSTNDSSRKHHADRPVTVAMESNEPEKKPFMSEAMKRKLMSLQHSSCL